MIVAITGAVPVLVAVKVGIFPLPVAANPMLISLLVHVYVVMPPVLTVVNVTVVVLPPLHTTWLADSPLGNTSFTSGRWLVNAWRTKSVGNLLVRPSASVNSSEYRVLVISRKSGSSATALVCADSASECSLPTQRARTTGLLSCKV